MKSSQPPAWFTWQAAFIVLPMVVLTVVGLLSLRQDRSLAEQAARERAERLAQELADRMVGLLVGGDPVPPGENILASDASLDRPAFEVTGQLSLVWPPPVASPPTPRLLDETGLSHVGRDAWDSARGFMREGNGVAAAEAWGAFLATDPPSPFAGLAAYELAHLELELGRPEHALARLDRVATNRTPMTLESGLPLAPLASWKATEFRLVQTTNLSERSSLLQAACSNLVFHPTALSPVLLERVGELANLEARAHGPRPPPGGLPSRLTNSSSFGESTFRAWQELWEVTQLARSLFGAAREDWERKGLIVTNEAGVAELAASGSLPPIWVELFTPEAAPAAGRGCTSAFWLLTRDLPADLRFQARTDCEVRGMLARVRQELPEVPPYFDCTVTVADRTLPAPLPLPRLAERPARAPVPDRLGGLTISASVYLADAAALYAHQRQRTWWFGAVVLTAAATAGAGLFSAARAFQRQLRLSEMKSNFVSSVSHELRAPIASVRLLAESLERGKISDEAKRRDYFRLIGQECRRLSSLVENVLDFSRIDQGRRQYEFEPTDVLALVTQTLKLMEPYAAERQVILRWHPGSTPVPTAVLDGKAIQQALVNLIDNAVKHAPAGTAVTVALSVVGAPPSRSGSPAAPHVAAAPAPGHWSRLTLAVTDEGPGIPRAEQARIFEPFYRRGSELHRETTGVGIGLSIVRHVAEAHAGLVRVDSEPGQGSRFVLEVPLCPES